MNQNNGYRFTIYLTLFLFSSGCKPFLKSDLNNQKPHKNIDGVHEIYKEETLRISRNKRPDVGLALSGGGIRSTLFCIGAMKSMYEQGILEDVDVISSVSGGSYANYWLYNKEIEANKSHGYKFGDGAFGVEYANNLAEIQKRSRMFPIYRTIAHVLLPRQITVRDYQKQMHWSFGGWQNHVDDLKFRDLENFVKTTNSPYPIINATISATRCSPRVSRNFEFSPVHIGNPEVGWDSNSFTANYPVSKAVAISGAAVGQMLYQNYPKSKSKYKKGKWKLSDGGHNENLGAIALVRRGVKKLIILDAEHSPKYEFEAYDELKRNLSDIGMSICVKGIEDAQNKKHHDRTNPLPKGIFTGRIYNNNDTGMGHENITVYYVKMSYPKSLRLPRKVGERPSCGDWYFKEWKPVPSEGVAGSLANRGECLKLVDSYGRFLNQCSKLKYTGKIIPFLQYSFPQMTTGDQSLRYPDQVAALLALGYLQGSTLETYYK